MAVVAFINCDPAVIGLRLNQSHVMWLRVRDGLVGRLMEDIFFFLIVVYLCDCGVRKTELCVCVCTRVCKCMDVCLRMHNAQTVN